VKNAASIVMMAVNTEAVMHAAERARDILIHAVPLTGSKRPQSVLTDAGAALYPNSISATEAL
jgi:hypothetical protein